MQYKCGKCNDSGSLNKFGPYYDCTSCDAAEQRVALEKWCSETQQRGPSFDDCWAIHQRALAMAPKQEVPAGWKLVPEEPTGNMFRAAAKIDNEMFAGGSSHGAEDGQIWAAMYDAAPEAPIAAPAAANGTLTDEQILIIRDTSSHSEMERVRRMLSPGEANIAFARAILAAAGPDAALIDERQAFETWIAAAFDECGEDEPNLTLDENGRYTSDMRVLASWEVWQARAALSGAKGN